MRFRYAFKLIMFCFFLSSLPFSTFAQMGNLDTIGQQARSGEAEAQYEMGKAYFQGAVVPEDKKKASDWFKKSAEQGHAKAQFYLGLTYSQEAAYIEVISIACNERDIYKDKVNKIKEQASKWNRVAYSNIKKLAESGDPEAQYMFARMNGGWAGVKNEHEALKWRNKAVEVLEEKAKKGDIEAQRLLGEMCSFGLGMPHDSNESANWYAMAAEQGDAIAQYELGIHYKYTKECEKSIQWLTKAAEQGHVEAQYELGQILEGRCATEDRGRIEAFRNDVEAIKWYKKAAEQEHTGAQYQLGLSYLYNEKTKDSNEAIKWLTAAAEQGYFNAQSSLANTYYLGEVIPQDYGKAFRWFKEAEAHAIGAEVGVIRGILANMYFNGLGVEKNYEAATDLYGKLAEQYGDALAQYRLGRIYYEGLGVEKNVQKSATWYIKAAESGYPLAQYQLARMYYNGNGVLQDYVEAYMWANLAAMKDDSFSGFRDIIKQKMTVEQIAEGQKKAKEIYDKERERSRRLWESLGVKKQ